MNVLVTGGAGYLASLLLPRLVGDPDIGDVVALDLRAPRTGDVTEGVRYVQGSILDDNLEAQLRSHRVGLVAHLAWVFNPSHDREHMRHVDVDGTRNVVTAAAAAGVEHLLYLSSTTAYGAFADNPAWLTEHHPTRATGFPYAADKAAVEALLDELEPRYPQIGITRARPCIVLGGRTDNFVKAILQLRLFGRSILLRVRGHDTEFQFLAEDDLAAALHLLVKRRPHGAFNIVPNDAVTLAEMATASGRPSLALPLSILRAAVRVGWTLRLFPAPVSYLEFVRWPWLASPARAAEQLGFTAKTTSREAALGALGVSRCGRSGSDRGSPAG